MPLVTVVIPTYNRAGSLARAIRSVLAQTEQDFEIVVVDDGSTDMTEEVIRGFADPRITYLKQPANRGDAAARNAGMGRATGRYIAFLDDDDEWMADKLQLQCNEFARGGPQVGLVYGGRETHFVATGRSTTFDLTDDVETQLRWFRITTSTVTVRREAIEKVGAFDESMPCASDYDLWIRLWCADFKFVCIARALARYYVHANGLTGDPLKMIAGGEKLLTKNANFFAADPVSQSEHSRSLGMRYCAIGEVAKGRGLLSDAMRIRPSIWCAACYALSLLGSEVNRRVAGMRVALRRRMARRAPLTRPLEGRI